MRDGAGEDAASLARSVVDGDERAVAHALNLIDDRRPASRTRASALLEALPAARLAAEGHLIGLTGPPGAGKSTLTAALVSAWRQEGLRVAILAVDPSSPLTGGALLGDRLRLLAVHGDGGVFVRSLASRRSFGGLSAEVWPMALVLLAAFDRVLIETVGVGQREIDVAALADTTALVAQPGSGDVVQLLKAGIMEVPDLLIVNKADTGAPARRLVADLEATAGTRRRPDGSTPHILAVSATRGDGIADLLAALTGHRRILAAGDGLPARRREASAAWVVHRLGEEFGTYGLDRLGGPDSVAAALQRRNGSPFALLDAVRTGLVERWQLTGTPLSPNALGQEPQQGERTL